jgi:hypothetical protein
MDLPLQIGVAEYHLAKLRKSNVKFNVILEYIMEYIDRSDFESL